MASADELGALGYDLVIFPGALVRALAHAAREFLASLKAHGTTAPFGDRMLDLRRLNALIGTDDMPARGARYDMANVEDANIEDGR